MKLHLSDRWAYFKDSLINFRKYRMMKKVANRDWFDDINSYDDDAKMDFRISDDGKHNTLYVNGQPVLHLSFGETAMFYRFLKKCIYR